MATLTNARQHRMRTRSRSARSEEHTSELQSQSNLVCRLLLEKKKNLTHFSSPQRFLFFIFLVLITLPRPLAPSIHSRCSSHPPTSQSISITRELLVIGKQRDV